VERVVQLDRCGVDRFERIVHLYPLVSSRLVGERYPELRMIREARHPLRSTIAPPYLGVARDALTGIPSDQPVVPVMLHVALCTSDLSIPMLGYKLPLTFGVLGHGVAI
jgi:hypothetical protein